MKHDKMRVPGFYWFRFEGDIQVAEWAHGSWIVAGSDMYYDDREVCELLSPRLEPPKYDPNDKPSS